MDKRRAIITKQNEKIEQANREIKDCYVAIGNELLSFPAKSFTKTPLAALYKDAKNIQNSIEDYEEKIGRIQEMSDRLEEIKNERQSIESTENEIEKENTPIYAQIGEEAFRIYRDTPAQYHEYAEIFSPLMEQQNELTQMERDITALDSPQRDKGVFGKIVDKSQATFLRGKKMVRLKTLSRFFQQIGEKVCNSDFIEHTENDTLASMAQPYYENQKRIDDLNEQKKQLVAEEEKLDQEMAQLVGEQRPNRRIDELNVAIKDERNNLYGIYERMGITYYKAKPEEIEPNDEINKNLEKVAELEKNIESSKEIITKIEADIEADRLADDIKRMERSIDSLEADIKRSQDRIAELRDEIATTEEKKKENEKIRGPKEKLPLE